MGRKYIHDFETGYDPLTLGDGDSLRLDPRAELYVYADPAVTLTGGHAVIRNHGLITTSGMTPIFGHLTTPFDIRIVNSASIYSRFPPNGPVIVLSSDPGVGGELHILNSGGAVGSFTGGLRAGIDVSALHADRVYVVNTGMIDSHISRVAYAGSDGSDRVRNSGTIFGDVDLGAGDDVLRNPGDIYSNVHGGDGDDRISAGYGRLWVWGGAGRDVISVGHAAVVITFDTLADSAPDRAHADLIRGFDNATGDTIVLGGIDADTTLDGNQAFHTIGSAVFSGVAGELRCDLVRGGAVIFADVDGDAQSDFALVVRGEFASLDDLHLVL